jgi:hypothetical protein
MPTRDGSDAASKLAEAVPAACVETAVLAYEDAGFRGLCQEGRWEHALAAIRRLDLRALTNTAGTLLIERGPTGTLD